MPIVIDEVEFTITSTEATTAGNTGTAGNVMAVNQQELVKACVEKVMEILQQKNER